MLGFLQPHTNSKNLPVLVIARNRSREFGLSEVRRFLQGLDQVRGVAGITVDVHLVFANVQFLEPGAVGQQVRQLLEDVQFLQIISPDILEDRGARLQVAGLLVLPLDLLSVDTEAMKLAIQGSTV